MTSGHRKLFQLCTNAYRPTVSRGGVETRTIDRQRCLKWLAPSIWVGSHRSLGMLRKNWRSRKIENTLTHHGTEIAVKVSNHPAPFGLQIVSTGIGHGRFDSNTKFGMSVTSCGIIIVPRNTKNSRSRPGKRRRAKAYPASTEVASVPPTVVSEMSAVLAKKRGQSSGRPALA